MSLIHYCWRYDFYSQMLATFFWLSHSPWNHYLAIRFRRWGSQSIDFLSSGFQYISTDWVRCCHKWRDPPDWKMTQIEPLVHLSNWNRVVFKTHSAKERTHKHNLPLITLQQMKSYGMRPNRGKDSRKVRKVHSTGIQSAQGGPTLSSSI